MYYLSQLWKDGMKNAVLKVVEKGNLKNAHRRSNTIIET